MEGKKVLAIIGCGRIAQTHFPALDQLENVHIKYACDLIPEKAEKMKETYPDVEYAITDYKIALEDPEWNGSFGRNSIHDKCCRIFLPGSSLPAFPRTCCSGCRRRW